MDFKTIEWKNNQVLMIDQRKLPVEEVTVTCKTYGDVGEAIQTMVIRGAPAIGVAAAMGVALGALSIQTQDVQVFSEKIHQICEELYQTRPTAVNLGWALNRMKAYLSKNLSKPVSFLKEALVKEAQDILKEDIQINRKMGEFGEKLIQNGDKVLTHCNAGALATAGFGTALGVLYAAALAHKKFEVFADETRPFLQGARLTAWELQKNNIPVTLITDNMAGWMMKKGQISKVIVGADRIAANGDVANKIGTYSVALLAKHHQIPFYVAAPFSTIDLQTKTGENIPIEERSAHEVTHIQGIQVAPNGIKVRNPAFDVTPHEFVTAIITEKGIIEKPYDLNLTKLGS